jgi:hypothetical protein
MATAEVAAVGDAQQARGEGGVLGDQIADVAGGAGRHHQVEFGHDGGQRHQPDVAA